MATWPKILRLNRTDNRSKHLLLNIAKDGSGELDIRITGTDQESLYRGAIATSDVQTLRANNFTGDLNQWKTIVSYVLLHHQPEGLFPEFLQGVEAVSAVSGANATITLRRNVGGVTQKLGTVKLERFEEDIDIFEWVNAAVIDADGLRAQVQTLGASVSTQQEEVSRLTEELDQLIKAKNAHEQDLLSKFAALLNAKKLKIRDQERLLRGGGQRVEVSAENVSQVEIPRQATRKAGSSRNSKRKAGGTTDHHKELSANRDEYVPKGDGTIADDDDEDDNDDDNDDEERWRQVTPETEEEDDDDQMGTDGERDAAQVNSNMRGTQVPSPSQRMDVDGETFLARQRQLPTREGNVRSREAIADSPSTSIPDGEGDNDETDDEL